MVTQGPVPDTAGWTSCPLFGGTSRPPQGPLFGPPRGPVVCEELTAVLDMTLTAKGTVWNVPGVTLKAAGFSRREVVRFQFDSRIWTLHVCNSSTKPIVKLHSSVFSSVY